MNRFNLDPVFTLNLRRVDKGYISNLVTVELEDKIEKQIESMSEYKDAKLEKGKIKKEEYGDFFHVMIAFTNYRYLQDILSTLF